MRSLSYLFAGLTLFCLATQPAMAQENGEPLLNEAVELKLDAKSPRELDKVAELCEEAIEAGLEEESMGTAQKLWASACFEHARILSKNVFSPRPDRRWKFQRQQALERLEKAVELVPDMTDAWLLIAQFNLLDGGDAEAAREAVARALETSTDDPGQQARSLILRAQTSEDSEQRKADIDQALKMDPDNALALRVRGRMYLDEEKYEEAIEDFTALARQQENNPVDLVLMAESLRRESGKEEMALKAISRAIEINPEIPAAYSMRSALYLALEKKDEALADATRAIEMNPRDIEAIRSRATIHLENREFEEALRDVEKILMFRRDDWQAVYLRSFIYAGMEDYESAIADMQQLVTLIPDEPGFRNTLAMFYSSADQPEKAIRIYDNLIDEDSGDIRALRGRGDVRLSTGEHEQAIADYEAALKIDDADDGVLNNLAWVLATSTFDELRDGQRALELALKAAETTDYKEAHILSTLAAAYAETGDFENAVKWSEKSVELADEGRQTEDLKEELKTLRAGKPVRENEGEEKAKEKAAGKKETDDDGKSGADDNGKSGADKDKDSGDDGSESADGTDDRQAAAAQGRVSP